MKIQEITELVAEMAVLKFFPSEPAARLVIVRMIGEMANNDDQIRWLIRRMTSGMYSEWPGMKELRACFCHRFPPKDGINAYSSVYGEDLGEWPKDPTAPPRIEALRPLALPMGHQVTADAEMELAVTQVAQERHLPPAPVKSNTPFAKALLAAITPPHLRKEETPQVITAQDVANAVAELRTKKKAEGQS